MSLTYRLVKFFHKDVSHSGRVSSLSARLKLEKVMELCQYLKKRTYISVIMQK